MPSIEYITIHDTGNNRLGANSLANHNYGKTAKVSWHYSVGNDGIYQMIPESDIAWHAGDGTSLDSAYEHVFDTGVKAGEEKVDINVNWNKRVFTINGVDTLVSIPIKTPLNANLSTLGYKTEIINGNYYMRPTWYSQVYNAIGNHGGNRNSIGIESCIDEGNDLYLTWHYLAKLVADIMERNSLSIDRVTQHNYFSGKDCPMTLRAANLWGYFIELVKAEYLVKNKLLNLGFNLVLESSAPNIVDNKGRVVKKLDKNVNVEVLVKVIYQSDVVVSKKYKYVIPAKV